MQLRTDLALAAIISSLQKVVLPAVDEDNGPALEQLQIAIGLLALLAERLPLEYAFDRNELARLVTFAQELIDGVDAGAAGTELAAAADEARLVLEGARSSPGDLQRAARDLRSASGAVVTQAYAGADEEQRHRIASMVLAHAHDHLTRERAWLLPQGWEAQPDALPALAALLGLNGVTDRGDG